MRRKKGEEKKKEEKDERKEETRTRRRIERINKDMQLILYSPEYLGQHTEGRYIADIPMQKKQMTICENIPGSAGVAH